MTARVGTNRRSCLGLCDACPRVASDRCCAALAGRCSTTLDGSVSIRRTPQAADRAEGTSCQLRLKATTKKACRRILSGPQLGGIRTVPEASSWHDRCSTILRFAESSSKSLVEDPGRATGEVGGRARQGEPSLPGNLMVFNALKALGASERADGARVLSSAVPEPGSYASWAAGLGWLATRAWRRSKAASALYCQAEHL
jgi:hypothetical protein